MPGKLLEVVVAQRKLPQSCQEANLRRQRREAVVFLIQDFQVGRDAKIFAQGGELVVPEV